MHTRIEPMLSAPLQVQAFGGMMLHSGGSVMSAEHEGDMEARKPEPDETIVVVPEGSDSSGVQDDDATILVAEREALPDIPDYEVQRLLGTGGMAKVYLAEDVDLKKQVAIKVMNLDLATDEDFRARFQDECRILANLDHPNIIRVYTARFQDQRLYMVMDYMPGETLQDRLAERGVMTVGDALAIAEQTVAALGHVHARNIIHRDFKPANVLFKSHEQAVLTDFGIAKSEQFDSHHTQTGVALLTVRYASPEQLDFKALTTQSDIYSFGAVLFEMLTGQTPKGRYRKASRGVDTKMIRGELPEDARHLASFIVACLQEEPTERPTAAECVERLQRFRHPASRTAAWLAGGVALVLLIAALVWWSVQPKFEVLTQPEAAALYVEGERLTAVEFARKVGEDGFANVVAPGYVGERVALSELATQVSGGRLLLQLTPLTNPLATEFQAFDEAFDPAVPAADLEPDALAYPPFSDMIAWLRAARLGQPTSPWSDRIVSLAEDGDAIAQFQFYLAHLAGLIDVAEEDAALMLEQSSGAGFGTATYTRALVALNAESIEDQDRSQYDAYLQLLEQAVREGSDIARTQLEAL